MNENIIFRMLEDLRITRNTLYETVNQMVSRGDTLKKLSDNSKELEEYARQVARGAPRAPLTRKRIAICAVFLFVVATVIIYLTILR
jgi:hypothetical protein